MADDAMELQKARRYAQEYLEAQTLAKSAEDRRKSLREVLMRMVGKKGDLDEKGNQWLPAHDHLIKVERRVSTSFNAEKAEEWLRERGWWDQAKVEVPAQYIPAYDTIDEDAMAGFIFQNRDDEEVPDTIPDDVYVTKESSALKVSKEDQYDY